MAGAPPGGAARGPPRALPAALAALLGRTLLATFRVSPRPASLGDSMAVHAQLRALADPAKLMHYHQALCPVTKERLERLQVLLEDPEPRAARTDVVVRGELVARDPTALEARLAAAAQRPGSRLRLDAATRDADKILSLKCMKW